MHQHTQAPENPADGDTLTCPCGASFEFVDLHDGQPGEWVDTTRNEDTPLPVVREDKYRININGTSIVATNDQEARIRAMSRDEQERFIRIMGG